MTLGEAYANIVSYGAVEKTAAVSARALRQAIRTGGHVLIPHGEFWIDSDVEFPNDGQRCTFLAGASLRLIGAGVRITGKRQSFYAMNVAGDATSPPDPCVDIDGADDLLLVDFRASCNLAVTLVRVRNANGVLIHGGHISGVNELNLNTGINLGAGVKNFRAKRLTIDHLGHGVILDDETQGVSFTDGTIEAEHQEMILVRGTVYGLALIGMHMESGTSALHDDPVDPDAVTTMAGAYHFVVVSSTGAVRGALFLGCELGALRPPDGTDSDLTLRRRVFLIQGTWDGVTVMGCWHNGGNRAAILDAVYEISSPAVVTRSGDMFNYWESVEQFGPERALTIPRKLPTVNFTDLGSGAALRLTAPSIRLDCTRLGFFGVAPVEQPGVYVVGTGPEGRNLTTDAVETVLRTLLWDLSRLGLIRCTA